MLARHGGAYDLKLASGKTRHIDVPDVAAPAEVPGPWEVHFPPKWGAPEKITLDTLLFANTGNARIAGYLRAPEGASATGQLVADSLPLADIGAFAQLPEALSGALSLSLHVGGTKDAPTLALDANARALKYAGLSTDLVHVDGNYAAQRLALRADVRRGERRRAQLRLPLADRLREQLPCLSRHDRRGAARPRRPG